jgi:hypothetical protein
MAGEDENKKSTVDIDGLKYHCGMIEVYLDYIKEGKDFLADLRHHIKEMQDIFDSADFRRVA